MKALYGLKIENIYLYEIEIINDITTNYPNVKILREGHDDLNIKISLSHNNDNAMAVAIICKN